MKLFEKIRASSGNDEGAAPGNDGAATEGKPKAKPGRKPAVKKDPKEKPVGPRGPKKAAAAPKKAAGRPKGKKAVEEEEEAEVQAEDEPEAEAEAEAEGSGEEEAPEETNDSKLLKPLFPRRSSASSLRTPLPLQLLKATLRIFLMNINSLNISQMDPVVGLRRSLEVGS
jgi:hypothetical protein